MSKKVLTFSLVFFFVIVSYFVGYSNGKEDQMEQHEGGSSLSIRSPDRMKVHFGDQKSARTPVFRANGDGGENIANLSAHIIPEAYTFKANALLQYLIAEEKFQESKSLEAQTLDKKTEEEFQSIALRLLLNDAQKKKLKALFEERRTLQNSHEVSRKLSTKKILTEMTEKRMIDFMALELMHESSELNKDQEVYFEELDLQLRTFEREHFESLDDAGEILTDWQRDSAAIEKINDFLQPSQQNELQIYLREDQERIVNESVFYRSEQLASRLGLNDVEKTHLKTFLEHNPNASDQEISEVLDPSLSEILLGN